MHARHGDWERFGSKSAMVPVAHGQAHRERGRDRLRGGVAATTKTNAVMTTTASKDKQ